MYLSVCITANILPRCLYYVDYSDVEGRSLCRIEVYQILVAYCTFQRVTQTFYTFMFLDRVFTFISTFNLNRCLWSLTYKNRCFSCSQVGQAAAQSLGCPWRRCPSRRQCSRAARTGSTAPGRFHVRCLSPGKTTSYFYTRRSLRFWAVKGVICIKPTPWVHIPFAETVLQPNGNGCGQQLFSTIRSLMVTLSEPLP